LGDLAIPLRKLRTGNGCVFRLGVLEDLVLIEEIEDREDLQAARAALREAKRKGTIAWTRIKKELRLP
jgi:hypothetical protein